MKKGIGAAIFIFIFSLLQNTLFSALSLGGIAPDLIMILAVSYGFMLGRKAGLFVGFTAGFIMDLFFGVVLGFYALCYMFVGFFAGHFHEPFFKEDIRLPLGMVVIGELGYNFVFYIIYEVFYLFILCLSICAMHFVKQNKTNDPYEFNKGAIISMIIINFILGILPIIFNISKIKPNIVNMLLYMILGASSSSSHFQMCYLFNFSDMYGGYSTEEHQMKQKLNMKERKSISLFALFAFNILFGFLTMLNNTRTRRVRTVQAFGIIFTVYNGMKVIK